MNTSRLYALALELAGKEEQAVNSSLEGLRIFVEEQVRTSSDQYSTDIVSNKIIELRQLIDESTAQYLHRDLQNILQDIGIAQYYGDTLMNQVDGIFDADGMLSTGLTLITALPQLQILHKHVDDNFKNFNRMVYSFKHFDIDLNDLNPGECEIIITIPAACFGKKLDKFGDELRQLSLAIFPPFIEINGQSPDRFSIRSISSSEPTMYLLAAAKVAFSIMGAVALAQQIYLNRLKIKSEKEKLKSISISPPTLQNAQKEIEKSGETKEEKLISDFIANARKKSNAKYARTTEELDNQVAVSIRRLVERLSCGLSINIRGIPHNIIDDPESDPMHQLGQKEENKLIEEINKNQDNSRFYDQGGVPLPSLLPDDFSEDDPD